MIPQDIRDKLSEIKLREIERLRELYRKKIELEGGNNVQPPEHIDHMNLNTFEKEDLKKLILKVTLLQRSAQRHLRGCGAHAV